MKIGVIGAGSWGSALSIYFSKLGFEVDLWVRERELIEELREKGENTFFLKGFKFNELVNFKEDFRGFEEVDIIFLTVPVQYLRGTLKELKKFLKSKKDFVNCSKGIEIETMKIPSEIVKEEMRGKAGEIASLSGPTFAKEVAKGLPAAAVFASKREEFARFLQEKFSSPVFRFYRSKDLTGVEMAGALKNIYAIGSGIIKAIELGANSWASYLTRALHEMKRFCIYFGGKERTLSGLAGFGDLVLTSSFELSRNYALGFRIGKGEKLEDILKEMNMVAEGVFTLKAVHKIIKEKNIQMPIAQVLYEILYKGLSLKIAVEKLMTRELKEEEKI